MNFKKYKRLLSIILSATMVLSTNLTGFAAEKQLPKQSVIQEQSLQSDNAQADSPTRGRDAGFIAEDEPTVTAEPETTAPMPEGTVAIVGTDGYCTTLAEALETVCATDAASKEITLQQDAVLDTSDTYNLTDVTIKTEGHVITIDGANIQLEGTGTFINTKPAELVNGALMANLNANKTIFYVKKGASLSIQGGAFTTAGVKLLVAEGDVTINGGTYTCDATDTQIAAAKNYDGASMFDIHGQGTLTMTAGTISADIGKSEDGMYGIFVNEGGTIVLGDENAADPAENGPKINSRFAAVGMNYSMPTGNVTIHSGTYTSSVACTGGNVKYNAVLYLAALCDVTINNGHFESKAASADAHVIAAPEKADRDVIINNGTFISRGSILSGAGFTGKKVIKGGSFSNATGLDTYVFPGFELKTGEDGRVTAQPIDNTEAILTSGDTQTKYDSLHDALKAARTGDTVEMTKNATLTGIQGYNLGGVTVNTKGYTISIASGSRVKLESATIKNDAFLASTGSTWDNSKNRHRILHVEKDAKLVIQGGLYETKGIELLMNYGDTTIDGNVELKCTATKEELEEKNLNYYDGGSLICANRDSILRIKKGEIFSDVGNGTDCGMYAVSTVRGGSTILGDKATKTGPTIDSAFAAVGMNNLAPSASLIIYGGTYTSSVSCPPEQSDPNGQFNAVLYLSATSTVTIEGGTFTADGTGNDNIRHVISVPYQNANVNLTINGGTFEAGTGADVFFVGTGITDKKYVKGGKFTSNVGDAENSYLAAGREAKKTEDDRYWEVSVTCRHKGADGASTITEVKAKPATCTAEGNEAHYTCSQCNQKFYTKSGFVGEVPSILTDDDVRIKKLSHKAKFVEAKETDATCQEIIGKQGLYICTECNQAFTNMTDLKNDANAYTGEIKYGAHTLGTESTVHWGVPEIDNAEAVENAKTVTVADRNAFESLSSKITQDSVSATLHCSICEEDVESEATINVADDKETALANFDCATGATVTYTVALEDSASAEPSATSAQEEGDTGTGDTSPETPAGTVIGTCKVIISRADHSYKYTWNVSDDKKTITVSRYCGNCQKESDAVAAKTIDKKETTGAELQTACWDEEREIKITASQFTTNATDDAVSKNVIMVVEGQHNLEYKKATAPTCLKDGNYAHYLCKGTCGKYYRNPLNTSEEDAIDDDSEFAIRKLDHNFGAPSFEWDDVSDLTAKATFTCRECNSYVTLGEGYVTTGDPQKGENVSCEEETDITYDVSVKFDASKVGAETGKDDFGDAILAYTGTAEDGDEYKATLERKGVVAGHRFEVTTLEWADTPQLEAKLDITKGAVATLTCKDCKGVVTINANGASVAEGTTTITNPSGRIRPVKSEELSEGVTCSSDGKDVYTVTVLCKTGAETEYTTYTTMTENNVEKDLILENTVEAKGHEYVIRRFLLLNNGDVSSEKGIDWENPETAAGKPDIPSDVIVTLQCKNDPRHKVVLTGKDVDNKDKVVLTEAKDENAYPDTPYKELSCTVDGVNAWAVAVTYQDKLYKKYDTPGEDVPSTEGTNPTAENSGSDQQTNTIYVTKTKAKTGHQYPETPTWNWDKYLIPNTGSSQGAVQVDPSGDVYCDYICQNSTCSNELDETDETDKGNYTPPISGGDNKWHKRFTVKGANVSSTGTATCTKPGEVTYTAKVNDNLSDSKKVSVQALGHKWATAEINWEGWSISSTETVDVTIGEGDNAVIFKAPKASIKATLTCEECKSEADTATGTKEITGTMGDTAAHNDIFIKVEAAQGTAAPTCTTNGSIVYKATICNKEGTPLGDALTTSSDAQTLNALGHEYDTEQVSCVWTDAEGRIAVAEHIKETKANDRYYYTVEMNIPCKREGADASHTTTVDAPVTIALTTPEDGTDADGCRTGITYTAKYENETQKLNITKTYEYTGDHKVVRIAGTDTTATCGEISYPAHFHCTYCGRNYNDPSANTPVEISYDKLEHSYRKLPKYEWINAAEQKAQAVYTCMNCGEGQPAAAYFKEGDTPYEELRAECVLTKRPEGSEGTYYYTVYSKLGDAAEVSGSLEYTVASVDHKLDADGKCEYCQNTFIPVTFQGWQDSVVSKDFYICSEDKITLENGTEVTAIKDAEGNITSVNGIVVPKAPTKSGYTFKGWKLAADDTPKLTGIEIDIYKKLAAGEVSSVTILPHYEAVTETATIKVYQVLNGAAGSAPANTYTDAPVGQSYTLTAAEKVGEATFSHWSLDADGSTVLSNTREYKLYISSAGEKTIYAVYGTTTAEVKPAITDIYAVHSDKGYQVAFASAFTLPEGCKLQDSGFLYGTKQNAFNGLSPEELKAVFILDSENTYVKKMSMGGTTGNIVNVSLGTTTANLGATVWARAYVRYSDSTGKITTVYSDVATGIYNALAGQAISVR